MSSEPDAPPSRRDRTEGAFIGLSIIVFAVVLMWAQKRWAHNFPLVEHDRYFWATMLVVFLGTVGAAEALWHVAWRRSCRYSPILGFAMMVGTYHVFYPIANGALDRRPPERRTYIVARRSCHARWEGRRAAMWLRPATPGREFRFRVSRRYCEDTRDGEELSLDVKPGFFGTAWIPRYEEEWW